MTIVDRYEDDILQKYMRMHPDVDQSKVKEIISNITEKNLKNIPSKLNNNITTETISTDMISVFEWMDKRKPIITGNGTFFKQHAEELAPEIPMLEKLGERRGELKKKMYEYKPGTSEYLNLNTAQGNVKVIMNAEYGGSGTPLSPFFSIYIPSATTGTAKNLTTTLICCLEYLTVNNDRWAKNNNVAELFDCINIILNDTEERYLFEGNYTPNEVSQWLISRTNNVSIEDKRQIDKFVASLTNYELTKLMHAFNIHLVITKYLSNEMTRVSNYLKEHRLDIENISKESLMESGYGVTMPVEIEQDLTYISKMVCDNCVYAYLPNDAEFRCNYMTRKIVCVTDTDSLMVHFSHYIDTFNARVENFVDSCIIASAIGMRLIIEFVIPKFVKYWAINCGIEDEYYRNKFVFKNEFGFLTMALIAKKMYAASMFVQEGKSRNPHDIAVTGLSFKKRDTAKFLEPIMLDLYDKYILTSKKVDVSSIYSEYSELREKIKKGVVSETSYFKVQSFQDPNAYDPKKVLPDQIRGSLVWSNIMVDESIMPADRVMVVNLSFDLLEQNADKYPKTKQILELSLVNNENKKHSPVICIPEHYKEIPEWICCAIDAEFMVDKLLSPFKQLMSLFDFFIADTRGGILPSRMMYL